MFQYKATDSGGIALKIVDTIRTRMSSWSLVNENLLLISSCALFGGFQVNFIMYMEEKF